MLLLDKSPIEIWRMLLPKKFILHPKERRYHEELIFHYRNFIYFVHEDGDVVRMKKPPQIHKFEVDDLWELLFHEKDVFDYDDHGIFSMGAILLDMGFLAPLQPQRGREHFLIDIIKTNEPELLFQQCELKFVSFQYALYKALVRCYELQEQDAESEYEIRQIVDVNLILNKTEPI